MLLVNFVYDDEELLEPYEWQEDDNFEEIENVPIYHVSTSQLHDFLYAKVYQPLWQDGYMLVGDGHYCFVVDIQKHGLVRRGTLSWQQSDKMNALIQREPVTFFQYQMKEEAYDKEFGLTRHERLKKMCLEEMIDEIFVVKYDVFVEICKQLHIEGNNPSEKYLALKHKIEKGYTSLHELLYKELVQKE
ncbi:MAG: hypothetical protein ACLSVX_10310 [Massilimicrobiota timonensis]